MIIQYSISEKSVAETREMLLADQQGHRIYWDLICFVEITLKNDAYSKHKVSFSRVPFFLFMEDLKWFWDENKSSEYAKADISCIDQFYSFRIEKEKSQLLFSRFAGWEKWEPVKIQHEGVEKEVQRVCRHFLKDYSKRLPLLLDYSQINLIKKHFDI